MRRLALAAATVLLSTLGACGGSDDPAPATGGSVEETSGNDTTDEVLDTCGAISTDEVGAILDGTFASELGPFDACEFDQEDPRAISFSLDAQPVSELGGGFDVYKSGSVSALTGGKQVDVAGVGDEAFITTGTFADGTNIQLQAGILVDGQVLTISLTQASDIAEDVLIGQATELMKLIVTKV